MFKRTQISTCALLALGGVLMVPAAPAFGQDAQRIEVTGSRLKRAQTEGALPVTVITREQIESSGQVSVAELMRETTFSSFGNFKPQSGSSAQALADIDLRGLGSNRTLVLIDGRRISKAPFSGQSQDLNAVPLAAVERIEILSDGASAIYGSDAIGGVVNIITRKNFNGMQLTYGEGNPDVKGGDSTEFSLLWGAAGSKGRMFAGISANDRGMIFTRDQIGGGTLGVSSFGNNYQRISNTTNAATGALARVPGFACNTNNFWVTTGNTCSFDFNAIAANEASIANKSAFANGEFNINNDWQAYASGSVSVVDSFGRYAPTPVAVRLAPTSPAYLAITAATPGLAALSPLGLSLRHRMAAAGARDSTTDATVTSGLFGVKGRVLDAVDVDLGGRAEKYRYVELGKNYIVRPLLEAAITSGAYDIFNPFGNSADVLNGVKNTISRDDIWNSKEVYGSATTDLFKIQNRSVSGLVGFEYREEYYQDNYDPLSEAGLIEGSAGNSASGSRKVGSAFFEVAAPILSNLELSLAGRYDKYNDAGSKFSPKASVKWQPMKNLTLRSSIGEGFRAPTLDVLTQKPAFSADSVFDTTTCVAFGGNPLTCPNLQVQVDATVIANTLLKPEESKQFTIGAVFDPVNWASITVDYYDTKIDNRITNMSAQTIINRTLNPALGAVPALFSVTRDPATGAITNVTRGAVNEGTLDTSGVDMSVKTDFNLGTYGRLQNNLQISYVNDYSINGGRNVIGDQGTPRYRVNLGNTWTWNKLVTNLAINHIAKQPDPVGGLPTKAYTTVNLVGSYKFPTQTQVTVGILNLENKKPELLPYDGRPWNFYLYDALGRQVFVRLQQTF
jgi:iron complex outermembrane receptor protein